jgi:hypothetical protein
MRKILSTLLFTITAVNLYCQTPQIAVVKPNGTSTIHTTVQAAYDAASDDDYIYLPGGTFSTNLPSEINKRLHIIGAGMNADSSSVTGITKIPFLILREGAAGGSLEGVYLYSNIGNGTSLLFSNQSPTTASLYSVLNCFISNKIVSNNNYWSNITIVKCVIEEISAFFENSFITNCHIWGTIGINGMNFLFSNNIFFNPYTTSYGGLSLPNNSTYINNIFQISSTLNCSNSIFHNNVNGLSINGTGNFTLNSISETWDLIFENPGSLIGSPIQYYSYFVTNSYHIKPTSACKNSGTDGTDRGIYGGAFPWKDGSIPPNPHIYFKNVAGSTNSGGQLQVHYKVRTGN